MNRDDVIAKVAALVPGVHSVNLGDPTHGIVIEVVKVRLLSLCCADVRELGSAECGVGNV